MAATAQGSRLTAQQRQLQLALRALTVRDVIAVWRLLDPTALGSTWPGVETALARIVSARRTQSALLAARYISAFRAAELGGGTAPVVPESPVDSAALRTSLAVTGPATIERLARTQTPAVAGRTAMTRVVGAVTRHVLDGGRAMLTDTIRADRQALGWARSASGSACAFCAMLAGRGPVYRSERTSQFRSHDNCGCGIEPVYSRDAAWPAGSERHREQWDAATSGLSGAKALNAYRASLPG
ncbi:VG15 protein [Spirillospora sp. NBC_01491]|uniref:VG15 protein n=1 Tax=Spirillospora sp. NBC_01491 TaxID=2976007 RepID=UPI002E330561|nr:hypothetical protein [Spirillospora sp. NBC_01491]